MNPYRTSAPPPIHIDRLPIYRRNIDVRRAMLVLLALVAVANPLVQVGCGGLTPTEQKAIAFDGVRIGVCQERGRECKRQGKKDCFGAYDDCMRDAGLRDEEDAK